MSGQLNGSVVYGASLQPIPGVILAFRADVVLDGTSGSIRIVRTDDRGHFWLEGLAPGLWSVEVKDLAGVRRRTNVVVPANATTSMEIDMSRFDPCELSADIRSEQSERRATVQGQVMRAATGKPVADAAVTILRASGEHPDFAPLTNSEGWFSFEGLTDGIWKFRALTPDGENGTTEIMIGDGLAVTAQIYVV